MVGLSVAAAQRSLPLSLAIMGFSKSSIWTAPVLLVSSLIVGNSCAYSDGAAGHNDILIVKSRDSAFYRPTIQGLIRGLKARGYDNRTGQDMTVIALSGDELKDQRCKFADR